MRGREHTRSTDARPVSHRSGRTPKRCSSARAAIAFTACLAVPATAQVTAEGDFALFAAKVLALPSAGPAVIDRGAVIVREGRIAWVGSAAEAVVPDGVAVVDLGDLWVMPGMIDLHSHIGGSRDINDAVYQANPGLHVRAAVEPNNRAMQVAVASGVTTVLFIPGSATTVGGQGVVLKTAHDRYERALVRDPGALKIAQADNPVRWGYGMGRIFLNWTIDEIVRRGLAYAAAHEAAARGEGPSPDIDVELEIFRALARGEAQIATHTQVAQVVLSTIRILKVGHGLDTFINHGEFDAPKIAHVAEREGLPAILGPRNMTSQVKSRGVDHDGRIEGLAWGYQQAGHRAIGFNTDAPVMPAEELFLQAAIAVRLGFDDSDLATVRGLTTVPARTVGLDHRIGSLEPGKDADLVVVNGHPADPRTRVHAVWIDGRLVYEPTRDGRRF